MNTPLDETSLRLALTGSDWIQEIYCFKEIDSTNDYLKSIAFRQPVSYGTLVVAEKQNHGRGRFGKTWVSHEGKALMFSLLFPPVSSSEMEWMDLGCDACYTVIRDNYFRQVEKKYPNDLLIHSRKFCGILTEIIRRGNEINRVIMGIGMNVNQSEYDFSPSMREYATSLAAAIGHPVDRLQLLVRLVHQIEHAFQLLMMDRESRWS
jgi:BirA family biotin operon repressor/biotin-[acetyl-CoA-carboxylase] ligase